MPPRPRAVPRPVETITISSSDEDHDMDDFQLAPPSPGQGSLDTPPDYDDDFAELFTMTRDMEAAEDPQPERTNQLTEGDCLARILEVFSDIAHSHVLEKLRAKKDAGKEANGALCDEMIVEILDGGDYPKEREVRRENLKRKYRASSEETEPSVDTPRSSTYKAYAIQFLLNEFLLVPKRFIHTTILEKESAFHAYLAIEEAERQYAGFTTKDRPYRRVGRARSVQEVNLPPGDTMLDRIPRELANAKKKVERDTRKRTEKLLKKLEEEENEALARSKGEITECGCCFGEFPTNRMTFCNGEQLHFFCFDCAKSYVSNEIGQRKCRPKCMDTGGCSAEFSRSQLKAFLENNLFETLERLQQQQDLRDAGIEDLEECPFCDFKMICAPKEVDREFRCCNDECSVVSCRLCQQETHVPLTCEQAAKEKKIDVRHKVEEAMTAALIRECNKCKNKFIKDYGCNKMTCTSCRNIQCYVCSKDVKDYNHFSDRPGGCPLYENTEQRHEEEVKKAEEAAFAELKKDNPNMADQDLKIQVSEAVKKAEQDRIKRGARHGGGGVYLPRNNAEPLGPNFAAYFAVPPMPGIPQLQFIDRAPRPPRPAGAGEPAEANRRDGPCPCEALGVPRGIEGAYRYAFLRQIARVRGCHCGRFENPNPQPNAAAAPPEPVPAQNPGPAEPLRDFMAGQHLNPQLIENNYPEWQRQHENFLQQMRLQRARAQELQEQQRQRLEHVNRILGLVVRPDGVRNPHVAELQRVADRVREEGRRREAELRRVNFLALEAREHARRMERRTGRADRAGRAGRQ